MKELSYLNRHFLHYKWHLFGGILFVAISNLFAIFPAQIIRYAIDFVQDSLLVFPLFDTPRLYWFLPIHANQGNLAVLFVGVDLGSIQRLLYVLDAPNNHRYEPSYRIRLEERYFSKV